MINVMARAAIMGGGKTTFFANEKESISWQFDPNFIGERAKEKND